MLEIVNMIGNTILRTCRTILAILLIELARVTNLKPSIEAKSTSNANYQGSKPELDSKVLVEPSTEQTLRLNQVSKPDGTLRSWWNLLQNEH